MDIAELPRKVAELLAHLTSVMKKSYICQVGYKIYPRSRGGPTNAIATARGRVCIGVCVQQAPIPPTSHCACATMAATAATDHHGEQSAAATTRAQKGLPPLQAVVCGCEKINILIGPCFFAAVGASTSCSIPKKNIIQ